jgi:acetylornithine deacetylase
VQIGGRFNQSGVASAPDLRGAGGKLAGVSRLDAQAAFERTEIVELVSRLVAVDSVNPTLVAGGAGEGELGRVVADWLEAGGVAVEIQEPAPGRPNVIGHVRGSGGGRSLLLNAHLDTVAPGGPDGGIEPRVEGARLYGRGAYDMKGSLAAIMLVARAATALELAGDVIVAAVADEEAFSIGSERVAASIVADAAIVAEPTDMRLAIAHKGFVWAEIETRGRAAHGSRYDLGVDAIAAMGETLVGLGELDRRLRAGGEAHPLLGGASLHASLIEGGQELSTYPDRCLLTVERRMLPGETVGGVEAELQAIAPGARVTMGFSREPLETPADTPIVRILSERFEDVLGRPPELVGVPFWTDAALFAAAGMPTVVFGPGGEGAHADVEWVSIDDVERVAEILLAAAAGFCS